MKIRPLVFRRRTRYNIPLTGLGTIFYPASSPRFAGDLFCSRFYRRNPLIKTASLVSERQHPFETAKPENGAGECIGAG
jgi:hypothetical protein